MEQDLVLLKKLRGALIMNHPKVATAIVNVLIADIAADDGVITDEERALINTAPESAESANSGEAPTDNTASPKLPSSTDVWNNVLDAHMYLHHFENIEECRKVAKICYEFIARKLRA